MAYCVVGLIDMGFFRNLRTASSGAIASGFVRNLLEVERACGTFKADPKVLSEQLVTAVLCGDDTTVSLLQHEQPNPVLLAAAALARGVGHFDAMQNKAIADVLFRCAKQHMSSKVFPPASERAFESRLNLHLQGIALSIFDEPAEPTEGAKALRTLMEQRLRNEGDY